MCEHRKPPALYTNNALAKGMLKLLDELRVRLSIKTSVTAYLAGGLAVYLYTADTAARPTRDVDLEFDARLLVPTDLVVDVTLEDGTRQALYIDTNYNPMFSLLHEDYQQDSIPLDIDESPIRVRVLSPLDLAVSKIARFQDHDREDIRALVSKGLVTAEEIEQRAREAMIGYVGAPETVRRNIVEAVALARDAEAEEERGVETEKGFADGR